jgi:hypothetical protein
LGNETIHLAVVDISRRVCFVVGAPDVDDARIVKRLDTLATALSWVQHTYGGDTVGHGDSVGAGEGAEVAVERSIFLHDDDHVFDLVDAGGG